MSVESVSISFNLLRVSTRSEAISSSLLVTLLSAQASFRLHALFTVRHFGEIGLWCQNLVRSKTLLSTYLGVTPRSPLATAYLHETVRLKVLKMLCC